MWSVLKQDFIGNMKLELIKNDENGKTYLSIAKFDVNKTIAIDPEIWEELVSKANKLLETR